MTTTQQVQDFWDNFPIKEDRVWKVLFASSRVQKVLFAWKPFIESILGQLCNEQMTLHSRDHNRQRQVISFKVYFAIFRRLSCVWLDYIWCTKLSWVIQASFQQMHNQRCQLWIQAIIISRVQKLVTIMHFTFITFLLCI